MSSQHPCREQYLYARTGGEPAVPFFMFLKGENDEVEKKALCGGLKVAYRSNFKTMESI